MAPPQHDPSDGIDPRELRRSLDELAVRRLLGAYGDAVTRRAWDEVVAMFVPGCPVELDLRDAGTRRLEGGEAVAAFIGGALERFSFFEIALLNVVVDVDPEGGRATGRAYTWELRQLADGDRWSDAFGLYRDRYVRTDDGWRFAERRYATVARTAADGASRDVFDIPG